MYSKVLEYTRLSAPPYLPFSPFIFCLVCIRNFSVFLMISTHLTTFHKICLSSDIRSHECSDWKELRVYLKVVVAWEVTPHSLCRRVPTLQRNMSFRLKDRNYFTSQKTAGVGVGILTRADTFDLIKVTEYGNPRVHCQRRLIRLDL
jgi:hypothetical protein